jgi:hypothetical protein
LPCLAVPFTEKQTEICIAQVSTKAKCDHSRVLAVVSCQEYLSPGMCLNASCLLFV